MCIKEYKEIEIKYHAIKRFSKRAGVPIRGRNRNNSPLKRKLKKAIEYGELIQNDRKEARLLLDDFIFVLKKENDKLVLVTVKTSSISEFDYYKRGKRRVHHNRQKASCAP